MLKVASLGSLLEYQRMFERYHDMHGASAWAFMYQFDVRSRLEHFERLRREAHIEKVKQDAQAAMGHRVLVTAAQLAYDENMPWEYVFSSVVKNTTWLWREFEYPAMMMARGGVHLRDVVSGDAAVGGGKNNTTSAGVPSHQAAVADPSGLGGGGGGGGKRQHQQV